MTSSSLPADQGRRRRGTSDPRREAWHQTLLSHGFRPFFFGAALYAALAVMAWMAWIAIHASGGAPTFMTIGEPPHLWHAHEMIFGFGAAAVGGFLLTAVPNWTGTERLQGWPLGVVFLLWLAGRCVMWFTASLPVAASAIVDLMFLPVLGVLLWRKFAARLKTPNLVFLGLIAAMVAGNGLFHFERLGWLAGGMSTGVSVGLGTLATLITIVGGRTIPGFTKNALTRRGIEDRLPVRHDRLDTASVLLVALFFIAFVLDAPDRITGAVALAAAVANGIRLSLWRTSMTLGEPIVWVLHLGYAWLVLGFGIMAAALLLDIGSKIAALHAFGTGAVGTMTLAMMSRASLGHSGRPLVAPRPVVLSYVLVSVAALLRAVAPTLLPDFYMELMLAAAATWILAFVLFTIVFAPILMLPRIRPEGP